MKTLLLLRHAKSDWDDASLQDFDRPLAARGERDAPEMGKALQKREETLPDLIVSSPAARAKATVKAVVKAAKVNTEIQYNEAIYGASSAELINLVNRLPDASSCAMLVGHNPGFEDLVGRLSGSHERMPTAALACLEFQVNSWSEVGEEQGKLVWLLTPKKLKAKER
ncbi:MAG TPA: histidine phosphatase family protein [Blastocatellia bacterium]|nr:histidine phosphatase family protein [Blastocatellia bacterium]